MSFLMANSRGAPTSRQLPPGRDSPLASAWTPNCAPAARSSIVPKPFKAATDSFRLTTRLWWIISNKPARLILRDRTPNTGDSDTLRVALGETSHPLSQDADYQRFDKPKGLLMWDLEVRPGAGPSAPTLRYAYSAEYDKNLTLQDITAPDKERLREEFTQKARATKGF